MILNEKLQVADNSLLLRETISRTGLLTYLSKMSRQRISEGGDEENWRINYETIKVSNGFLTINHFWGEECYKIANFFSDNEGFLNPDLISTLISSSDDTIKSIFLNPVDKEGKIIFDVEDENYPECQKNLHYLSKLQETIGSKFQHLLSHLARIVISTELHFVFCFDLKKDLLLQVEKFNIKELNFVRRNGYSTRLDYADFLQRYCFLAFNFDERLVFYKTLSVKSNYKPLLELLLVKKMPNC